VPSSVPSCWGVLRDGLTIKGISAFTFNMILGIFIIASMFLNAAANHLRIRTYDRAVGNTSVQELTELIASEYRQRGAGPDGPATT
jgi:hypothetical protein